MTVAEYTNYSNAFSTKNIIKLAKHTKINNYAIKLENNKQSLFHSIYSLGLVELKILKTDIKTNLVNSFIWFSKSLIKAPIILIKS